MVVRIIIFIAVIILFCICTLLMYGELKANRKRIERSLKKKESQFNDKYQKSYK